MRHGISLEANRSRYSLVRTSPSPSTTCSPKLRRMPSDSSFDIVSELNLQEMDNAVNQAQKEIATRYDFKGSAASIEFDRKAKELTFTADQEPQLEAVRK